jgi:hypothetical protein
MEKPDNIINVYISQHLSVFTLLHRQVANIKEFFMWEVPASNLGCGMLSWSFPQSQQAIGWIVHQLGLSQFFPLPAIHHLPVILPSAPYNVGCCGPIQLNTQKRQKMHLASYSVRFEVLTVVQTISVPLFKLNSAKRMCYTSTQCHMPQGWKLG